MIDRFEERIADKMAEYEQCLDGLSGLQRELVEDLLRDYCRVSVQLDDVTDKVVRTGTTIENRLGNTVKNPDITTMHQLVNEKTSLFSKLMKHAAPAEGDALDDLADFIRRG